MEPPNTSPSCTGRSVGESSIPPAKPQHPRVGQVVDVVARDVPHRAVLSIPGDGAVNDLRVDGGNRIVVDPEPRNDAGPEPFDDDVGGSCEAQEDRLPLFRFQVDRRAPFPAVEIPVDRSRPGLFGRERVAHPRARLVDLHDIRPVVRHHHRAERPRQLERQVQHADPREQRHPRSSLEISCAILVSPMEKGFRNSPARRRILGGFAGKARSPYTPDLVDIDRVRDVRHRAGDPGPCGWHAGAGTRVLPALPPGPHRVPGAPSSIHCAFSCFLTTFPPGFRGNRSVNRTSTGTL